MKITFPHMGNAYVAVKVLLDTLGLDYYMPPVKNRNALQRGIANSPEFMCLPFKTILSDFLQGLDHGADTILFGGGCGQCRLSYYGALEQEILRSMGYRFNYIHLDLSHLSYHEISRKMAPVLQGKSKRKIISAVTRAAWTVFAVDGLYGLAAKVRCREVEKGAADQIMGRFEDRVQTARGYDKIRSAILTARHDLKETKTDPDYKPLKIEIIGEIFIASEPFTNLEIEKKLGNMGVEVHNTMGTSMWIRDHFIHTILPLYKKDPAKEAAQEYLHTDDVGGHGVFTVGNAELYSRGGCDGIIHIYPFTCMPEIIAQTAFRHIQKKYDVPIMTLIVDEMTGEAGFVTRLEAFVDMLRMRKDQQAEQQIPPKAAGG